MNRSNEKTRFSKPSCGDLLFILAMVLVFTLAPAAALWANPTASISIKDRVEIDEAEVLLGQIAIIEGADARFNQRLKDIMITKAPLPGDTHQIDLSLVQKRLKQHQINLAAVIVEAPPQVIIARSHVEIQKEEIEKIVSEFIIQQVPRDNKTLHIKEIQVPAGIILPKGQDWVEKTKEQRSIVDQDTLSSGSE